MGCGIGVVDFFFVSSLRTYWKRELDGEGIVNNRGGLDPRVGSVFFKHGLSS